MALSYQNTVKAYQVFHELKETVLPELQIRSFPEDMSEWEEEARKNPEINLVYGFDKKYDSGWESIVFFVKNPSEELKKKFEELKDNVGNSSINKPYYRNKEIWAFGWF